MKKVLIQLYLIFFSSTCFSYSFNGAQLTDLYPATVTSDLSSWVGTGTSGYLGYSCQGTYLVGGTAMPPGSRVSRTYSNLSPHNSIVLSLSIWLLGTFDETDYVSVMIDGANSRDYGRMGVYTSVSPAWSTVCTTMPESGETRVIFQIPHTASTLTLAFTNNCDEATSNELTAISKINIQFLNQTLSSGFWYGGPNAFGTSGLTQISNYAGLYNSASCSANCQVCRSSLSTQCLFCSTSGFYFDGSSCTACPVAPTCTQCGSATTCVTFICGFSSYYYYSNNGSCYATCPSPLTVQTVTIGNPRCISPCGTNFYCTINATCVTTCSSPYVARNEGGYKYCDENPCRLTTAATRTYYLNGYCISCPPYCTACSSATNCSGCSFPALLVSNQCVCPPESFMNSSKLCQSTSYINLTFDSTSFADNVAVTANVSYIEFSTYPSRKYNWSVTTNGTTTTRLTNMKNYLSTQQGLNVSLLFSYIDPNTLYTITVKYSNALNVIVTNTLLIYPLDCYNVITCKFCPNSTICNEDTCGDITKFYFTGNNTCQTTCPSPFSVTNSLLGNNKCIFPCESGGYYAENGTCVSSCPTPYVTRNVGGYLYCDENPCKYTTVATRTYYQSPYCISCPNLCAVCTSDTVCSSCRNFAALNGTMCKCPSGTFLNASNICQDSSIECFFNSDCNFAKPYCDGKKCRQCLTNAHCPSLAGINFFCTNSYFCFKEPSIQLLGPQLINAQFNIYLFYLLSTDTPDFNVTWNAISSPGSSISVLNSLKSFLSRVPKNQSYVEIPFFLLEEGVEYNFTVTYSDIYGYTFTSSLHTLPSCPKETFLIVGHGCSGQCVIGCFGCDNPNTCTTCAPFAVLNSTTLKCDMFSTIFISSADILSPRASNTILAQIDQEELGYFTIFYRWTISSKTDVVWTNTSTFFVGQKTYIMNLPGKLLRPNSDYILGVSYINYIGQNISTTSAVSVGSANTIALQIDGGSYQFLQRYIQNTVRLFNPDPTEVYDGFRSMWTQIAGPKLKVESPTEAQPLAMTIPICNFMENSLYKFKITYMGKTLDTFNTIDFTVRTKNDSFTVSIPNGNRSHPVIHRLDLQGEVTFDNQCPDTRTTNFIYMWTCQNRTSLFSSSCADPNSLFGVYSNSSSISIPPSYFKLNQTYSFYLKAFSNGKTGQAYTEITIASANTLLIQFECLVSECTKYYSTDNPLLLSANINGVSDYNSLQYSWSITPDLQFVTLVNKFFMKQNNTNSAGVTLKISLKVYNDTHNGDCYLTLRYNNPPNSGRFDISPTIGIALSTYFQFSASDWLDDDAPLRYQYFYSDNSTANSEIKSLGDSRLYPDLITFLPGNYPQQTFTVTLVVTDFYKASSKSSQNVVVSNADNDFNSLQTKLSNILSTVPSYDSTQMAKTFSLVTSQIQMVESNFPSNPCPVCSNHGICPNLKTTCTCDAGWAGPDCSISNVSLSLMLNTKLHILNEFSNKFTNSTDENVKNMVMSALTELTSNPSFNNDSTIKASEDIIENKLNFLDPSTALTTSQRTDLATLLSNLIQYKSSQDCDCKLESCQKYANTLDKYFDKIASDSSTIPNLGLDSVDYSTAAYDLTIKQVPVCEIEGKNFASKSSAQSIQLERKSSSPQPDCSQIAAVKTFAMPDRSELFNCEFNQALAKTKSKVGLKVNIVGTGRDVTDDYTVTYKSPDSKTCPKLCNINNLDGVVMCQCPKTSDFDPLSQMKSIFLASDLSNILNFGNLAGWDPIESPVFWTEVVLFTWFTITFVIVGIGRVSKKSVDYLLVNPSVKKVILYNFLLENHLLSIYFVKDKELSKRVRAALYFNKILLVGLFNAVFGKAMNNQTIIDMISNLQILFILLPYWTMLPINIILTILIKIGLNSKRKSEKRSIGKILILGILAIFVLAASMSTFIIATGHDSKWEYNWLTTVMINICVDLLISPWIQVIFTIAIYYISVVKVYKPVEGLKVNLVTVIIGKLAKKATMKVYPEHFPNEDLDVEDIDNHELTKLKVIKQFFHPENHGHDSGLHIDSFDRAHKPHEGPVIGGDNKEEIAPVSPNDHFHEHLTDIETDHKILSAESRRIEDNMRFTIKKWKQQ